jgi:hypothetical protein
VYLNVGRLYSLHINNMQPCDLVRWLNVGRLYRNKQCRGIVRKVGRWVALAGPWCPTKAGGV